MQILFSKQTGIAVLILDKVEFKQKMIRDRVI